MKNGLEADAKELNDKIMPIGAKMYESAQNDAKSSETSAKDNESKPGEEPIEGEVVDNKKD